jgi:hypothetical protein
MARDKQYSGLIDDDINHDINHGVYPQPSAKGTTVADCFRVGSEAYLQFCTDPCYTAERRAKQWANLLKAILALGPDAVR